MKTKKRFIAILLSLIFSLGVGHFYVGRYKKALFLLLITTILYLSIFIISNFYLCMAILILMIGIYLYAIIDVWRLFPIKNDISQKYSRWYFVLLFVIFTYIPSIIISSFKPFSIENKNFLSFIAPSKNMQNSLMLGDIFFAQKNNKVERNQVVVLHYPLDKNTHFIERVVAKAGDEVIYIDSKLLLHFVEGDAYIKERYPSEFIKKYRGKLWVENPYMIKNKNIHYTVDDLNSFKILIQYLQSKTIAMKPIYLNDESLPKFFLTSHKPLNAFYLKVEENSFFMVGDNRNNSNDSRFWGVVHRDLIYGVVKIVYFNMHDFSRIGTRVY